MLSQRKLGELLLERRLITPEQLNMALIAQEITHEHLGQILIGCGYVSEENILRALASQQQISPWFLDKEPPTPAALRKLPHAFCEEHRVLPVQIRGDLLIVGVTCPFDTRVLEQIKSMTNMRVEPVMVSEYRLDQMLDDLAMAKTDSSDIDAHMKRAMTEYDGSARAGRDRSNLTEADTRPVVGLANEILSLAIRMRASDIHIEPQPHGIELRFRLDGQLHKIRDIPGSLHAMLVTRIKIMAEIDIVEQRLPLDGHISAFIDGRHVDLRVSTLPGIRGERVVLRVLDRYLGIRRLSDLGFVADDLDRLRTLVQKPYGLFLVTGPTGSGKTTTLYAALQEIRTGTNNIMTCEDPVEYEVPGISQSQINEKIGLTFAAQLRAILRQDPDVILVGEIRDQETAETAIRASLTGHMVFSTLHCNDALAAIPRLLDVGIEPYLLSTSLVGVLAQRLVRKLCPHCRTAEKLSARDHELFVKYLGVEPPAEVATAGKCDRCHNTGYRGRIAVAELMPVTENVASLIAQQAHVEDYRAALLDLGFRSLQQDALRRVISMETTLEEVRRVVAFDEIVPAVQHVPLIPRQAA